ncbi:hypothetical protein NG2371_03295 [Nocardia gamkensis]|nr:hypothetical protein [Nocardia gamkensis]
MVRLDGGHLLKFRRGRTDRGASARLCRSLGTDLGRGIARSLSGRSLGDTLTRSAARNRCGRSRVGSIRR